MKNNTPVKPWTITVCTLLRRNAKPSFPNVNVELAYRGRSRNANTFAYTILKLTLNNGRVNPGANNCTPDFENNADNTFTCHGFPPSTVKFT